MHYINMEQADWSECSFNHNDDHLWSRTVLESLSPVPNLDILELVLLQIESWMLQLEPSFKIIDSKSECSEMEMGYQNLIWLAIY